MKSSSTTTYNENLTLEK